MKFLADMGISPRTVNSLKNQGYDAIHLVEQGLEKLEDELSLPVETIHELFLQSLTHLFNCTNA